MAARAQPLETQLASATGDPVRVLVVGAGVAGMAVAQLLRRQGWHPVVVDRARDDRAAGYMLALMPMVDPLIDDLDARDRYLDASVELGRYRFRSHTGREMRTDSMAGVVDRYGDYRGISRSSLQDVLWANGGDVTFQTTVAALEERPEGVRVTLRNGEVESDHEFDLVIVADGIRSTTRDLVPGSGPLDVVDTRWGGWVAWVDAEDDDEPDLGDEIWGAGFFLGTYPVQGRIGAFLGGPAEDLQSGPREFVRKVRGRLRTTSPRVERALAAVAAEPDPYYWPLDDVRTARWTTARTVLLGDAAAGFLPTAGIGAGMAMESAWVLARMLAHAPEVDLAALLAEYERIQKPRVEAAQSNSRALARLMFRRSRTLAVVREWAARALSVTAALGPIVRLLQDPPDPERAVAAARVRAEG
ncbi:FAD-dependent oxidoreductase [Pseudactinotalea suaedae]|uniref:FAD-dependent oxidoreductase n=1 Tax=Pseudactinotalea suaedae TaxID=1524924 RepID=UPI0012E1140A|nr:NAD(P)/FAD-dependent oxidoreductase [Pseudactinotalea suaedae]